MSDQRAQGKSFFYTIMEYTKGLLPLDGQIKHLKSKGLSFADEAKALLTLQHVSYFRLKSYLKSTMYDRQTGTYKAGATFFGLLFPSTYSFTHSAKGCFLPRAK